MYCKSPDKLCIGQSHLLFASTRFVVFVVKDSLLVIHFLQAVVADGNFMRVPAKVFYHLFRPTKWPLGTVSAEGGYTTQSLANSVSINGFSANDFSRSMQTYFARNTLESAFTGNKYFPLTVKRLNTPCTSTPAPGTMQCRCACPTGHSGGGEV